MSVLTMIIGCIVHLVPMILWIVIGIHAEMDALYYIVLGVFSVIDVIDTLAIAKEKIKHLYWRGSFWENSFDLF